MHATGRIRVLDAASASQLRSAQECTSVAHALEELVVNALDAQATEVHCVLDVPGFSMTVRDNGCGMSADELGLVGDRHATSKLKAGADAFGFRGAALHALAAASLLEIVSRIADTRARGMRRSSATTSSSPASTAVRLSRTVAFAAHSPQCQRHCCS